jgi:guanylate kinase
VDKEYMENEITADKGSFLEIARVHHNIYGTSANEISRINEQGKVCVLDVDMAGVMSLKKLNVAGRFIFIKPPSLLVLETRLRERGTENEDQISLRMKNNCEVMKQFEDSNHFDFQVTNDNIEKCYEDIIGQMQSWYSALQLEKVHSP